MLLENKYKKIYYEIISKALSETRNKKDFYYERHHILPKSMGGNDNETNLVLLTAREHYICHKLLTKFTTGESKRKMFCAFWAFNRKSTNQQRCVLNSRDYEYARVFISKIFSQERKGVALGKELSPEHKKKLSKALKGKKKSEETKNRMKESWKLRPPRSQKHCMALSEANKGRVLSKKTREKMSNSKKGINPVHTQILWECPHCGKTGIGVSNYNRWHNDNCKAKLDA